MKRWQSIFLYFVLPVTTAVIAGVIVDRLKLFDVSGFLKAAGNTLVAMFKTSLSFPLWAILALLLVIAMIGGLLLKVLSRTRTVSEQDRAVYRHLIKATREMCQLDNWEGWTSWPLAVEPSWDKDLPEQLFTFRRRVMATNWPTSIPELERAIQTLSLVLHEAAQTFLEHAELKGNWFVTRTFYKDEWFKEDEYRRRFKLYDAWLQDCYELIEEATKAANWFADVARKTVDPNFFATEGKFIITSGPYKDLSFRSKVLEYSEQQKLQLPQEFLDRRKRKRSEGRPTSE